MDDRKQVVIKNIRVGDLKDMIEAVFGSVIWVGGACYPDSECEIRIVQTTPEKRSKKS